MFEFKHLRGTFDEQGVLEMERSGGLDDKGVLEMEHSGGLDDKGVLEIEHTGGLLKRNFQQVLHQSEVTHHLNLIINHELAGVDPGWEEGLDHPSFFVKHWLIVFNCDMNWTPTPFFQTLVNSTLICYRLDPLFQINPPLPRLISC